MPLDDTILASRLETEIDGLTRLGLTPVSVDVITAHKDYMVQRYRHRLSAQWRELELHRNTVTGLRIDKLSSMQFVTPAPKSVTRLALEVADAIPNARFVLGYFYTDPYLKISYDGKSAYLALWTNRWWTKAIAKRG